MKQKVTQKCKMKKVSFNLKWQSSTTDYTYIQYKTHKEVSASIRENADPWQKGISEHNRRKWCVARLDETISFECDVKLFVLLLVFRQRLQTIIYGQRDCCKKSYLVNKVFPYTLACGITLVEVEQSNDLLGKPMVVWNTQPNVFANKYVIFLLYVTEI